MDIESNWGNCKSQNITEDLTNIRECMKANVTKKFIPVYPTWVRNYADKFGLLEGVDFMVLEHYGEAE